MMCGEFEHVIIDIEKRPVEEWLYKGNYESDREFRKQFHQWLMKVWEEKDRKLAAMKG